MYQDVYNSHCIHGNPVWYDGCPACREAKERKQHKIYTDFINNKTFHFCKYVNDKFNYYFHDPSLEIPSKIEIRNNDKFASLKRSKSEEELRKQYYKLAKIYHPDKSTGSNIMMKKLNQLYDILLLRFTS